MSERVTFMWRNQPIARMDKDEAERLQDYGKAVRANPFGPAWRSLDEWWDAVRLLQIRHKRIS